MLMSLLSSQDAQERLQRSVLERTLQKFDAAGDALAARASLLLLRPGHKAVEVTTALRTVLTLLLRCVSGGAFGAGRLTGRDLLELVRGDVALAVAVATEALAAPAPPGLPRWGTKLAQMLHQLTTPEAFHFLLQWAEPELDYNATPIEELHARQLLHSRVLALSFVQFDVLDRALKAAEDPAQRQAIMASLFRAVYNIIGNTALEEPGRLLSRNVALDFMRFGFRFLAPYMRKLLEDPKGVESVRLLRHACRTLSWLVYHAEADGSSFMSEALRPLASEWALRGCAKGASPPVLAALVVLTANCGALGGSASAPGAAPLPSAGQLLCEASAAMETCRDLVERDVQRSRSLTPAGVTAARLVGLPTG